MRITSIVTATILGLVFPVVINNLAADEPKKLKVAVILPLTSYAADYGYSVKNSIELAIADTPDLYKDIEFQFEDNSNDSKLSVNAFHKQLRVSQADLFITWGVSSCKVLAPLAEANHVPLVGVCIDPETARNKKYVARFMNVTDDFMKKTFDYLNQKKLFKIAVLLSDHPYSEEMYAALQRTMPADFSVELLNRVPSKEFDFRAEILKIKNRNYDAYGVFLDGGQVSTFYKQARQLDLQLPSFGNNIMESLSEVEAAKGSMNGVIFANIKINPEFETRYYAHFGNKSQLSFGVAAYELTRTLGELRREYPTLKGISLIDQLARVDIQQGIAAGPYQFIDSAEVGKYFSFPLGIKQITDGQFKNID